MELTRRQLFQWGARLGAAGATGWVLTQSSQAQAASQSPPSSQKGMLIDITRCVGCRLCKRACASKWGLDPTDEHPSNQWTWLTQVASADGPRYVRNQCFHCLDPACVSACPVAALRKTAEGAVIYEEARCLGCRYCMLACPFQIPRYEWHSWNPAVTKCVFCYDRLAEGEAPACAVACPTGATLFGDREALLAEARRRIAAHPDRYVPHIYGEHEAGGTAWLFLSDVPFEELGFRTDVPTQAPPRRTDAIMRLVPPVAGGLVAALGALAWWNQQEEAGPGVDRGPEPKAERDDEGGPSA